MTKQEIIYLALENLQRQTRIQGKWDPTARKNADGKLVLELSGKKLKYYTEIKDEWRNHHLEQIMALNKAFHPLMVVAIRLFPKIKEELRNQQIAYLEANGNIYLRNNEHLIWIDANEPYKAETKTGNRVFTKTGLKVLFQFLQDEAWVNKPYRQIAKQTKTGIGNITNIITGLKQDRFLLPIAKNEYRINNKKALLDKWITTYDLRLKPALKIGTFRFLREQDFTNWKELPLLKHKTLWGAEPAGDILTHYLSPAELTLYTDETRMELIKNYKLIPDEKGNVKAYQKFWQQDETEMHANSDRISDIVVPPLLVYTDLMNTGDRRCIETAQKIYDEFLQDNL